MNGCEYIKCNYFRNGKCIDPNDYVNKIGENVCGRMEDAILYDDYIQMLNENPPMMPQDRPSEF